MTDNRTRDDMIKSVHLRAADNKTGNLFPATISTVDGEGGGEASPAFGGLFAPMALNLPVKIEVGSARSGSNVKAIAGGVVGGVAGIILLALTFVFWRRRQRKRLDEKQEQNQETDTHTVAPYDHTIQNEPIVGHPDQTPGEIRKNQDIHVSLPTLRKFPGNLVLRRNHAAEAAQTDSSQPSDSTAPNNPPNTDDINFREEFEQLRRTVEELRATGAVEYDSPPEYRTQSRASSL